MRRLHLSSPAPGIGIAPRVNRFCLPALIALALLAPSLFAIPQNFNQGGFFGVVGVAFETFATDKQTWAAGATLPGKWSGPDQSGARKLQHDAVVFGLPAAEIVAQRSAERVAKLRVSFLETGRNARPLLDRVTDNIRAFTGDSGRSIGKQTRVFRHAPVQIMARQISPRHVVIEFTPLA